MLVNIKVKTLDANTHDFVVDNELTVREFKEKVLEKTGISPAQQRIIYCGRILADDRLLKDFDLNDKVIHVAERPPHILTAESENNTAGNEQSNSARTNNVIEVRPRSRDMRNSPLFRALDGMVLGRLPVPTLHAGANMNQQNGGFPFTTSSSFCMNRITVARHMLDCANNIAAYLEDPTRGLNNSSLDILAQGRWTMESTVVEVGISATDIPQNQNFADVLQGAVSAALSRVPNNSNVTVVHLPTVYGHTEHSHDGELEEANNTAETQTPPVLEEIIISDVMDDHEHEQALAEGNVPVAQEAVEMDAGVSAEESSALPRSIWDDIFPASSSTTTTESGSSSSTPPAASAAAESTPSTFSLSPTDNAPPAFTESPPPTPASGGGGAAPSNSTDDPNASRRTGTGVLADVIDTMRTVQTRMEPFVNQYYDLLREEPDFEENDTAGREQAQRLFDRVSEALHYMSHAQHAISDLMLDVSQPAPRYLQCRPILVEQSGYVSSTNEFPSLGNIHQQLNRNNGRQVIVDGGNNQQQQQQQQAQTQTQAQPSRNAGTSTRPSGNNAYRQSSLTITAPMRVGSIMRGNNQQNMPPLGGFQLISGMNGLNGTNPANSNNNDNLPVARLIQAVVNSAPVDHEFHVQINAPSIVFGVPVGGAPAGGAGFHFPIGPEYSVGAAGNNAADAGNAANAASSGQSTGAARTTNPIPDNIRSSTRTVNWRCPNALYGRRSSESNASDGGNNGNRGNNNGNRPDSVATNASGSSMRLSPSFLSSRRIRVGPGFSHTVSHTVPHTASHTGSRTTTATTTTSSGSSSTETSPTDASNNNNSQTRSTTLTLPTTATQTRSTSRPQLQMGTGPWNGRVIPTTLMSSFDRFLPCNSHHIREPEPRPNNNATNSGNATQNANVGVDAAGGSSGSNMGTTTATDTSGTVTGTGTGTATSADNGNGTGASSLFRELTNSIMVPHFSVDISNRDADRMEAPRFLRRNLAYPSTHQPRRHRGAGLSMRTEEAATQSEPMFDSEMYRRERLRLQLKQFIEEQLFNGEVITDAEMSAAINKAVQWFCKMLIFMPQYDLHEYDSRNSVENLLRCSLPMIINLLNSSDDDNCTQFEERLRALCTQLYNRLYSILHVCVGRVNAELYWSQLMRTLLVATRSYFYDDDALSFLQNYLNGEAPPTVLDIQELQPFLAQRNVPNQPPEVEDTDVEMAELSSSTTANPTESNDAPAMVQSPTPEQQPDIPLPPVIPGSEPWHNDFPEAWLGLLTHDGLQDTSLTQEPLSDAYLGGMTAKQRKHLQSQKPPCQFTDFLSSTINRAIESCMPQAASTSGVAAGAPQSSQTTTTPMDGIDTANVAEIVAADPAVNATFVEALRSHLQSRFSDNNEHLEEDYPKTAKFLNKNNKK